MSKKLAERERADLDNRTAILMILVHQLQQALGQMSNIVVCYPEAWHVDRSEVAFDLRRINRAVNRALADLLSTADSCHHMDKHQRKRDVSGDVETN